MSVSHSVFRVGRTQWVVLSADATQNRVKNAHGGPKRRSPQAPTAVGGTAHAGGIASELRKHPKCHGLKC